MKRRKQYVLREQTEAYLKEARKEFNRSYAELRMKPTDVIQAFVFKSGEDMEYEFNNGTTWLISIEDFDKYFIEVKPDDEHLLNAL